MTRRPATKRAALLGVAALVATAFVGVTGGSAGAGGACMGLPSSPGADGRVRELPVGPLVGNGVYNLDGAGQTALFAMDPGDPKQSFEVSYRNASTKTRTIAIGVYNIVGDDDGFVVKVFRGDKDVTAAVTQPNSKKFKSRPPGSTSARLRVQVRMKGSASQFDLIEVNVRGRYGKQFPFCADNVQVKAGFIA